MKARTVLALPLVLGVMLGGVVKAEDSVRTEELLPMCQPVPEPEEPCIQTGDAYFECSQLGLDLDWAKRIGPISGTFVLMDQNDLVEVVSTKVYPLHLSFDWWVGEDDVDTDYDPIGAVLVKSEGKGRLPGGILNLGGYSIYTYDPPAYEDSGLYGYYREIGQITKYYQIDHITFCWTHLDENGDEEFYQEETAWGDGDPYVEQGNWGTYFAYPGPGAQVDILAGQYMDAGYLTFGEPDEDWVEITVTLENGFVFYYDVADTEVDENLKVQDYDAIPPAENPAIGLFDWKVSIEPGSTTGSILVPLNNYYGVHLDVAYPLVDDDPEE